MRKSLILTVGLLVCSTMAFAQAGHISLYSELSFSDCSMEDVVPGLQTIYVVHKDTPGATASHFLIETGGGFGCVWVGEQVYGGIIICPLGPCPSGYYISYGSCLASDILLISYQYFCQGTSPPCAWLRAVRPPGSRKIEIVDCQSNILAGGGGTMYVNPDETCNCELPISASNWGKIKSLYH